MCDIEHGPYCGNWVQPENTKYTLHSKTTGHDLQEFSLPPVITLGGFSNISFINFIISSPHGNHYQVQDHVHRAVISIGKILFY